MADVWSEKPNIDRWTFAHGAAGCVAGYVNIPESVWILIMAGWEAYEQSGAAPGDWKEPIPNILIDVVAGYGGYKLWKALK